MIPRRLLRSYTPCRVRYAAFSGAAFFALLLATSATPLLTVSATAQPARPVTVARSLPGLTLSSAILPNGAGALTLSLPAGTVLPDKTRIALFEAGRPALVGDVTRRFTSNGNALQTMLNIEGASPGRYEVRVVSNDKVRTALTQPAPLLVPGVEREPGWWIFNGSIVTPPAVTPPTNDAPATSPTTVAPLPLFIPGLRRDLSNKPKPVTRDIALNAAPDFKLWNLISLSEATKLDATTLSQFQSSLTRDLLEARARGDMGYAGLLVTLDSVSTTQNSPPQKLTPDTAKAAVLRLRSVRDAVAPDAALVLAIDGRRYTADTIEAIVPLCDAVEISATTSLALGLIHRNATYPAQFKTSVDDGIWNVKIARRVAEDQSNFDLPILYRGLKAGEEAPYLGLDALVGGANLLIGTSSNLDAVYQRNSPLFVGSVTLEDAGALPGESLASDFVGRLRSSGRVPQYARVIPIVPESSKDKKPQPETFYARIDETTTAVQLEALRRSAAAGGRIYIEGSPDPSSMIAASMKELGGGTLSALPNKQKEASTLLKLTDPWFFGTLRNTELGVTQKATITLSTGTMAGQTKSQEGLDQLTSPRVVATLADGSPGMIVNPVGKGQVLWMPYVWNLSPSRAETNEAKGDVTSTYDELLRYDQAVSGWLGPALVQLSPEAARALKVMVRRSTKGTLLVSLINSTNAAVTTPLTVGGAPTVCLDLLTEQDFPVKTSGFDGTATVTVPAGGAVLLACALDRKALEDERNAPRLKAKLK